MLKSNTPDPKALKLLKRYDVLAERVTEGSKNLANLSRGKPTSPEDFQYMVTHGLAFPKISMTHDEAVEACFKAFHPGDKRKFSNLFVSGLGSGRPEWRSGLGAFALMQSMPRHDFRPNAAGICDVCSGREREDALDLTYMNHLRFTVGGFVMAMRPYEIQFFLAQQNLIDDHAPADDEVGLLRRFLNAARQADNSVTPLGLQKILKGLEGPKMSNDQLRCVIETLGLCGILQTESHPGYLDRFTSPGLAPHKTHSSDWAYPVDFWTGKDGLNERAVDFWFDHLA